MGAMLARLEGEILFTRLAESLRSLEGDGYAVRRGSGLGSWLKVPVTARG